MIDATRIVIHPFAIAARLDAAPAIRSSPSPWRAACVSAGGFSSQVKARHLVGQNRAMKAFQTQLILAHGDHYEGTSMKLQESVKVCLTKYADFTGRATRSEYWWFMLFIVLVSAATSTVSNTLGVLFSLATLLPSVAAAARRLHDTNRSGWWQLVCLVPVVGLVVLIVFLAQEGKSETSSQNVAG
jgi:uncharacterized membrane protein YhaH (DUF805 family)